MRMIMGIIGLGHLDLFAFEFGKVAEIEWVNTQASTNVNQSAPILVKMCVTIRSQMRLIMYLIKPELPELSALELEKLPHLTLFTM